jgi:glycosyltransferase involved in cell wall biosynthesis
MIDSYWYPSPIDLNSMNFFQKLFGGRVAQSRARATEPRCRAEKVLLIFPWMPVGGVQTLFASLINSAHGYKFEAVTTRDQLPNMGDRKEALAAIGCPVQDLPAMADSEEERQQLLWSVLEKGEYGTIYLVGSTMGYDLLPEIRRRYRKITIIDQLFADSKHVVSNQKLHEYIDATIVPSQTLFDLLCSKLQDSSKVHVIPHGIAIPSQGELEKTIAAGKTQMPIAAQDKFVVSFFGRLSPEKDPEMFVRIVNELKEHDDLYFCMVGDGPERDAVLKAMKDLGVQERIYFPGFVDSIDPLVSASDVIVVTSISDGQPLVVLHSQVYGRPVIASRVASIPIMVRDRENGLLVEATNLKSFCDAILELHQNRTLTKQLGDRAFATVRAEFDDKVMVRKYLQLMPSLDALAKAE